jgi:hypothetical protein
MAATIQPATVAQQAHKLHQDGVITLTQMCNLVAANEAERIAARQAARGGSSWVTPLTGSFTVPAGTSPAETAQRSR